MAKLGDLVVNIGANTAQLNKDLKKARRELRRFGDGFKQLGESMTKSITLPLTALGALAVKSSADLEKLETSFISLTGGAKQAADMMQQLNEFTAKTPFQIEAVGNAARQLIASGTEISEVNNQLQFLGDIAATSGSEINEIAAIFAKVNAKGKVELENLNQLAERGIPIFTALSEATGLLPNELGAGAVSVEEFNKTLKSFADEGGFAEGAMERLSQTAAGKFSTALDNLKLAGAELVKSLMPVLKDIIDNVTLMAQKFVALDDDTKKIILTVGGFVAALGPLLVIVPQVIAHTKMLGAALKGLNPAFVAISGGVALAVAAYKGISSAIENLETSHDKLNKTLTNAQDHVRNQTTEVRFLINAYKDEEKSLKDRQKILDRLGELDAQHFGNLKAESTQYEDLKNNLDDYTNALRRNFIEKALSEEGSALFSQLAADEQAIIEKQRTLQKAIDIEAEASNFTREAAHKNTLQITRELDALNKKRDETLVKIEEFEARQVELLKRYATVHTEVTEEVVDNVEEIAEASEESSEDVGVFMKKIEAPAKAAKKEIKELANNYDTSAKKIVESTGTILDSFDFTATTAADFAKSMNEAIAGVAQTFIESSLDMVAAAMVAGQPIENFGANLVGAFGELAQQLGKIAIGFGITVDAIKEKLLKNPKLAVVAGVALLGLGKLASAAADKAISENMPALAEGGLAFGPTTALVGDNRNASIDPEVIAPLSKLRDMLGGSTSVHGRISGDDILISNSRAMRDRNRFA